MDFLMMLPKGLVLPNANMEVEQQAMAANFLVEKLVELGICGLAQGGCPVLLQQKL